MTNREAIEYLKSFYFLFKETCEQALSESMDMAINALEEQDKNR